MSDWNLRRKGGRSQVSGADAPASTEKRKDSRSHDLEKVLACFAFDLVGKGDFGGLSKSLENMPIEQRALYPQSN